MNFNKLFSSGNCWFIFVVFSFGLIMAGYWYYEKITRSKIAENIDIVQLLEDYYKIGFETINCELPNHPVNSINIKDVDLIKDSSDLADIVKATKNDYFLILRISSMNCSTCVDSICVVLAELNYSRFDNFAVISNYSLNEDIINFLRASKLNSILLFDSDFLDSDKYDLPYFILVDRNLTIVNSYFPVKGNIELLHSFLSNLETTLLINSH